VNAILLLALSPAAPPSYYAPPAEEPVKAYYAPADERTPVSVSTPAPDPFPAGGYWGQHPVYGVVYYHAAPGTPAAPAVAAPVPFAPPPGYGSGGTTTRTTPATPAAGPSPSSPAAGPYPAGTFTGVRAATRGSTSGCST
jgi:hypothetical protein